MEKFRHKIIEQKRVKEFSSDSGVFDKYGRKIGFQAQIFKVVSIVADPSASSFCSYDIEPGEIHLYRVQATRNGIEYGASQRRHPIKSFQQATAAAVKAIENRIKSLHKKMVKNLAKHIDQFLPNEISAHFRNLNGADIANWLEAQGYEIKSWHDTGGNGEATTTCGIKVSSNGYVSRAFLNLGLGGMKKRELKKVDRYYGNKNLACSDCNEDIIHGGTAFLPVFYRDDEGNKICESCHDKDRPFKDQPKSGPCQNMAVQYIESGFHVKERPINCGRTGVDGNPVFCDDCNAANEKKYPQGWRSVPGDTCEHGFHVGDQGGPDYLCPKCEDGI